MRRPVGIEVGRPRLCSKREVRTRAMRTVVLNPSNMCILVVRAYLVLKSALK